MHAARKSLVLFLAVVGPIVAAPRISRAEAPADEDLVTSVDKALETWPSSERTMPRLSMRQAMVAYEEESKDEVGALALELVAPGVGSLYAHDTRGFTITWAGLATGVGLMFYGLPAFIQGFPDQPEPRPPVDNPSLRITALFGGLALMAGARVYGIANAVNATGRYNEDLRKSLGLMPTVSWTQSSRDNGSIDGVIPGVAGRF